MMKWICPLVVLMLACGGNKASPTVTDTASEPAQIAEPDDVDAPSIEPQTELPTSDDCVSECIASRQMQATSVDQIERDCRRNCEAELN